MRPQFGTLPASRTPFYPPAVQTLRIGHGYDLHRLEPRALAAVPRPLILGGVPIPCDLSPIAHSDGDALYHAVTDAILGALALPDIGQLFPDTDPRHAGAHSEPFLAEAVGRMLAAGLCIANLDVTVILEAPKLSPHKPAITANLARILRTLPNQVNVKGKTHEKVDAVGEGRAVEVHAVVLLQSPPISTDS